MNNYEKFLATYDGGEMPAVAFIRQMAVEMEQVARTYVEIHASEELDLAADRVEEAAAE